MSVPFATGRQLRPPGLRVPSTSLPLQACQAAGRWMRVFLVASAVRRTLLAVQLDDQLFLYGQVDLLARRHRTDLGRHSLRVELQPLRYAAAFHFLEGMQNRRHLAAALPDGDHVARLRSEERRVGKGV